MKFGNTIKFINTLLLIWLVIGNINFINGEKENRNVVEWRLNSTLVMNNYNIDTLYYKKTPEIIVSQKNYLYNQDYIVMFKQYYDQKQHQSLLEQITAKIKGIQNIHWMVVDRNNPASKHPSDFALMRVNANSQKLIKKLLRNLERDSLVKYVYPDKRIIDPLKKWQEMEMDDHHNINSSNGRIHSRIPDDFDMSFSTQRQLKTAQAYQVTELFNAHVLWDNGYTGRGTKVAIFDTGLSRSHKHFKNIVEVTNWTSEDTTDDLLGHGTFVAGVIASQEPECMGLAPDSELYIFRVFTYKKGSLTSWFLDAFNHAILQKVDVLNLSIGGPDFMDRPFVEKVWEMSANNIIVVSAIGNDGPLYGTLNNPADQLDVIGVGGMDFSENIASFSSRGMTTWEIPDGYGRVKPDIITYGYQVLGSKPQPKIHGKCRTMTGTSVSSPVVAGAISLLISSVHNTTAQKYINPGSIKQVLVESGDRIQGSNANIFEQGSGKLNLLSAYKLLQEYTPRVSSIPSQIDFTDCPYMWPYCTQELYHSDIPIIVNLTVLNGVSISGEIKTPPIFKAGENGQHLKLEFQYEQRLWPWSGHLGVHISVPYESREFQGMAEGVIEVNITSIVPFGQINHPRISTLHVPIRVPIIPTPPREKRILWDQFHSLRYPSGFFPRDTLHQKDEPFDWNGDHLHTNFRKLYTALRESGYYMEVMGSPLICFNPLHYGTLMIVDPEEEFHPMEIKKLEEDVRNHGLNLVVFADWYNNDVLQKISFFDENTQQQWIPATGGSNIPALNDMLSVFGIYLGDKIYDGEFNIQTESAVYSSGTSIIGFPKHGKLLEISLIDQSRQISMGRTSYSNVPILGFYRPTILENEISDSSSSSGENEKKSIFESITTSIANTFSGSSFSSSSSSNENVVDNLEDSGSSQPTSEKSSNSNSNNNYNNTRLFSGNIVIYGDSNCLDESHQNGDCYWLIKDILAVILDRTYNNVTTTSGHENNDLSDKVIQEKFPQLTTLQKQMLPLSGSSRNTIELPVRYNEKGMEKFSRVMHDNYYPQCNSYHKAFFWPSEYKYENITWSQRRVVLPSLSIPSTFSLSSEEIYTLKRQFLIPGYVLISIVAIFLLIVFFKKNKIRRLRQQDDDSVSSGSGGNGGISSQIDRDFKDSDDPSGTKSSVPLLRSYKPDIVITNV
ncbi:membrane-bound transcription factor peptidase [Tieghemostelium lacteum]|uniref:Membrane-bound transcription factor peptidase n=1 Tax=Tieghemostelium lacteum TaxID=361077 RepID=A0A152A0U8_TIELA|nr:membrane-bound transcription factor peptidase [Tieghemostelium lacteum]|eukprot:KYQ99867.1 membrane-bound transcription factor peptidase [Tieghemostelium lacteum]